MSVKYLGKQRPNDFYAIRPCAQFVNVPELEAGQRCPFCKYYRANRTTQEYQQCTDTNRCGEESLLYAWLENLYGYPHLRPAHYTPTSLIKQKAIDNVKRYLQLYSCDLQGYECSSLCQFYPARIDEGKTIAECSNTNACGRNGSFWTLLTLRDTILNTIPKFSAWDRQSEAIMTLDGTVIEDDHIISIERQQSWLVKAVSLNDVSYNIVNMIPSSPFCGTLLVSRATDPRTWYWNWEGEFPSVHASECIFINSIQDPIAQLIVSAGFPQDLFTIPCAGFTQITDPNQVQRWFGYSSWFVHQLRNNDFGFWYVTSASPVQPFIIQVGTNSGKYISYRLQSETPSEARLRKYTGSIQGGFTVFTLTSYNEDMTQYLLQLGFPKSLFTSLP